MKIKTIVLVTFFALIAAGCRTPATPSPIPPPPPDSTPTDTPPGGEVLISEALIESVEVLILESFPVQVNVVIRGILPDSCTELDETLVERVENRFNILITTRRLVDLECAEEEIPFEETMGLDVLGLPAGDYQVEVNGTRNEFSLAMDNLPLTEPPPVQAGTSTLSGRVWHDLCAIAGGEGGEPAVPGEGCVEIQGSYEANGVLEPDEPGLEGIILNLGSGPCPSVGFLTTLTDASGAYEFIELLSGTYCVSIDTGNRVNEPILIPGAWTAPVTDQIIVEQEIEIAEAGVLSGVNFGWDYEFLPQPETEAICTDRIEFLEDVTIPDNMMFPAGEAFEKTWRLKNAGTCSWGPEYKLVFVSGDQLGSLAEIPLKGSVLAGEEVEVSTALTAPVATGSYQGFWQLANPSGERFGFGENADQPFWVSIQVQEGQPGAGLGKPDWQDTFTDGSNWPLFEDDHGIFSVDDGNLVMTAKNPDWWNSWMLTRQDVADFQLEITGTTGECSAFDHYGLFFRAPDPNSGLLFSITCDGHFSLRKWDGEAMASLLDWTADESIHSGTSQTNRLRVKAEGESLTLYINDVEVATVDDDSHLEGRFGVSIGATSTENFSVEVDLISLWEIK